MKKIAIIPARSGSKGIKNKNIKILNNHPLIYYTINSAIKSKILSADDDYTSDDDFDY